jgi:hypothetical protein
MRIDFESRTAGQKKFIEERTRQKLVEWADRIIRVEDDGILPFNADCPYMQYALTRKSPFLSTKGCPEGYCKMLAPGWAQAATFLKR